MKVGFQSEMFSIISGGASNKSETNLQEGVRSLNVGAPLP